MASKPVVFTGHNAYMMSVARVCKEAGKFTDVVFVCQDGNVSAHRLVLAAASSTLRLALKELPAEIDGLSEYTVLVPDVKKSIVSSLVDFLYSGKLILSRSNSRDLQLLVRMLGIDPENVRIEALEESSKKRLVQTQLTTSMGIMLKQPNNVSGSLISPAAPTSTISTTNVPNASTPQSSTAVAASTLTTSTSTPTLTEEKAKTTRGATKRRISQDSNGSGKESRVSTPSSEKPPMAPIGSGFGRGIAKTRGTPKRPARPSASKAASLERSSSANSDLSGYHDMTNVETWVCAICRLYDPATSEFGEGSGDTTEWIGCDCNRWYHKLCTKLAVVDETFSCAQVKLECLPSSPSK